MLASSGQSTAARNCSNSRRGQQAPRGRSCRRRRRRRPWPARSRPPGPRSPAASVRAQMTKFGSRRAATAARMRWTISSGRHHGLAVEVAAPLGVDLVLEVAARQPGVLQDCDGAGGVHRLAEPGVGVDQRGQVGGTGDLRAAAGHLGQRGQPDVGQTRGRPTAPRRRRSTPSKPISAISSATSGVNAPGNRSSRPRRKAGAQRRRACRGGDRSPCESTHQKIPSDRRRRGQHRRIDRDGQRRRARPQSSRAAARQRRGSAAARPEPPHPRRASRNFSTYCSRANGRAPSGCASATASSSTTFAVFSVDLRRAPPKASRRVGRGGSGGSTPGPRPCGSCCHSATVSGAVRALGGVRALVVPAAVLQRDREDVHQRVVQGLPAGRRVELLRVASAGADHVVGVVAGVEHDRRDLLQVADAVCAAGGPGRCSAWLWYSAECSLV